jgi:hypothetical protein
MTGAQRTHNGNTSGVLLPWHHRAGTIQSAGASRPQFPLRRFAPLPLRVLLSLVDPSAISPRSRSALATLVADSGSPPLPTPMRVLRRCPGTRRGRHPGRILRALDYTEAPTEISQGAWAR